MGGLVTTALAEGRGTPIHGGIAFCPSIGGALGMMNMALDGAFAFRTLAAPEANAARLRSRCGCERLPCRSTAGMPDAVSC